MKKLKLLAAAAVLIASTSAFAQAYDLPLMLGIQGGWHHNVLNGETDAGDSTSTVTNFYEVDAFFDASFLRVSVGYSGNIGDTTLDNGTTDTDVDYSLGILELGAYFKYPLNLGYENATFYPIVGINYTMLLSAEDENGDSIKGDLQDNKYEDFFLMLGVGGDFGVSEQVYIVPSVLFGINLTPDDDDSTTDPKFSYKFQINLGVGFRL